VLLVLALVPQRAVSHVWLRLSIARQGTGFSTMDLTHDAEYGALSTAQS
jgi:hypothetical protein